MPLPARAGGNEVVVLYNSRMPESKAVADHYARLRQVPAKQIFGFALTTNEVMSRADFMDSLQLPLANKLVENGSSGNSATSPFPRRTTSRPRTVQRVVASKIRYAVLC